MNNVIWWAGEYAAHFLSASSLAVQTWCSQLNSRLRGEEYVDLTHYKHSLKYISCPYTTLVSLAEKASPRQKNALAEICAKTILIPSVRVRQVAEIMIAMEDIEQDCKPPVHFKCFSKACFQIISDPACGDEMTKHALLYFDGSMSRRIEDIEDVTQRNHVYALREQLWTDAEFLNERDAIRGTV